MSKDSDQIIIDLFQPDFSYAGSLLQRDALVSLKVFVAERIKELESIGESEEGTSDFFYRRFHRAVLIEGGARQWQNYFSAKSTERDAV